MINSALDLLGGGKNLSQAKQVKYVQIVDEKIAIINCCEHEFSIATENTAGSNPLNPICQYYSIVEAKKNADYVIVIVHGGKEHIQVPSKRMIDTYRFFIDVGADAVINHHQHCYCGMEMYNGKPIYYGLGNFCFDWEGKRNCMWNEGYLVVLDTKDSMESKVIPYTQCNDTVSINLMQGGKLKDFNNNFDSLCRVIQDEKSVEIANIEYAEEHALTYKSIFEPYQGWLSKRLYIRKLLPSRIHKSNSLERINFIECESHRDMLLKVLKNLE